MPAVNGILETSLYVADLSRAAAFYRDVLGFGTLFESRRLIALDAGRQGVLLLFPNNAEIRDVTDAGGTVPGHGGAGRLHLAFAIGAEELEAVAERCRQRGVESRVVPGSLDDGDMRLALEGLGAHPVEVWHADELPHRLRDQLRRVEPALRGPTLRRRWSSSQASEPPPTVPAWKRYWPGRTWWLRISRGSITTCGLE